MYFYTIKFNKNFNFVLKMCCNKLKFEAELQWLISVLESFYRAEPFAAHFISQVVDDIVDTVRKGQCSSVER